METSKKNQNAEALAQGRSDIKQLANRASHAFLAQENGQKALLTSLSLATLITLTWYLVSSPKLGLGVKANITAIIWVSCLYFFFQVYDRLLTWLMGAFSGKPVRTSFFLEFCKFFFTNCSYHYYMKTFVVSQPTFRALSDFMFFLIYNGIVATAGAVIFYRFRQMKDMALESRVAQAEAQYSLLESQMQPHFLFNSLNVLSELIYVDPDLANSMSQKLADLYREILQNSKNKFSTLESELSILEKYIEIQKIRFGERIAFSVNVSPAFHTLQIPSLMLQTLVENAIKHGISPRKEGGEIHFCVQRIGNLFEVIISNTGQLYKGHPTTKKSTGLQNTRNRLDLMYGDQHDFQIFSDDLKTYVQFKITGRST